MTDVPGIAHPPVRPVKAFITFNGVKVERLATGDVGISVKLPNGYSEVRVVSPQVWSEIVEVIGRLPDPKRVPA